jgi:HlyD family secretion protein
MRAVARPPLKPFFPSEGAEDEPGGEIALGMTVIAVFFVLIVGWAALTPLDAAVYAPGQVAVESHRQTVQHKEGGVVRAINVKEGQHVEAGDVLVELVGADVVAAQSSLQSQVIGLRAQRARLQAEQASAGTVSWPADFKTLTGDERLEAQRAMAVQLGEFRSRATALTARKAVLKQRMVELTDQVTGYQRQIDATVEQKSLIADELTGVKSLADKGYAPMSQVRSLERSRADLDGRHGEYTAQIAQAQQQSGELQLQILQLDTDQKEQNAKDLRDVEFQLNDLMPRLNAAQDQVSRMQVRAPASGMVVGLTVFTVGGVIAPGQKVLDIVPDKPQLVIEAAVSPADADALHVGETTEVRLGAQRDRTVPILKGVLTGLSADSLVNEKTGASYFSAEVTIPQDQLALLKGSKPGDVDLRPGTPAQVIVPTAKRTALQFLLQPLTRTLWRSFRER